MTGIVTEHKRIVARVDELLRCCDTLEAQLRQTRTLGAQLLDSTLHHLLAAVNDTRGQLKRELESALNR